MNTNSQSCWVNCLWLDQLAGSLATEISFPRLQVSRIFSKRWCVWSQVEVTCLLFRCQLLSAAWGDMDALGFLWWLVSCALISDYILICISAQICDYVYIYMFLCLLGTALVAWGQLVALSQAFLMRPNIVSGLDKIHVCSLAGHLKSELLEQPVSPMTKVWHVPLLRASA